MSLAPTLATERTVQIGVGLVASIGLSASIISNVASPGVGQMSVSGQLSALVPTITQVVGPTVLPSSGLVFINPLTPSLGRTLVVYPELPDTTSAEQPIAPAILLGNSESAGVPSVGYVSTGGLQPTLLRDNAAFAFIPAPSPVVMAGLVPVVSVPAGQEGTVTPRLGAAQASELVPTIVGELVVSAGAGAITVTGLVPTLAYASGWRTVALSGDAVWTDVPRAS